MESSFLDRLNTNYYDPTDAERRQIRQVISESLKERSRIDDEIARLNATIEDLVLQQQKIDEYVDSHRTLISDIRRLPLELMQKIFIWCLPPRNAAMSAKEAPMLLGRVCRAWRQISLSCPMLWSSLHLHATSELVRDEAQHRIYGDAVTAWLDRSGQIPLSISFVENYEGNWAVGPPEPLSGLLDILLRFSHRWRHFSVKIGYYYFLTLGRLTVADVPLLETLTLEITSAPSDLADLSSTLPFLHSPFLHTVSLFNFAYSMPMLPLRWESLTKLFFGSRQSGRVTLPFDKVMIILRRCCKLVACTVEITINAANDPAASLLTDTVSLPCLDYLGVDFAYWNHGQNVEQLILAFFNLLSLPKLRSLDVTGPANWAVSRIPFIPILERRAGKIESLSFKFGEEVTEGLANILPLLSATKRLHIHAMASLDRQWSSWEEQTSLLDETILEVLTATSSTLGTYPCPLLEDVEFFFPPSCGIEDKKLLQFILARTSLAPVGISRLKRAYFSFSRPMQVDILPDLQPMIDQGFKIRLNYHDPPMEWFPPPVFQPHHYLEVAARRNNWAPGFQTSDDESEEFCWPTY